MAAKGVENEKIPKKEKEQKNSCYNSYTLVIQTYWHKHFILK